MTTAAPVHAARVELQEVLPAGANAPVRVRVTVPGTAYRLDLVLVGGVGEVEPLQVTKRVEVLHQRGQPL